MIDPLIRDLDFTANTDFREMWALTASDTGNSLLTSASQLRLSLKTLDALAGDAAVIALTNQTVNTVTGIVPDASIGTNGLFQVNIIHADIQAVIGDAASIQLKYDFIVIETDGSLTPYVRGTFTFRRGVTYG